MRTLHSPKSGFFLKLQRHTVHAIAQSRRCWPIGKHMPQMGGTSVAMHLCARRKETAVHLFADHFRRQRRKKAWPPRAAVELGPLVKQGQVATHAVINARPLREIFVAARPLRAVLARHLVRKVRQLRPPFRIGFCNLFHLALPHRTVASLCVMP